MFKIDRRNFSQFYKLVTNPESREKCLSNFKKATDMILEKSDKQAAVLIPICCVNGNVSLLYTVRSNTIRTHKGQVSFPGGIMDKEDENDVVQCALRETEEELGLDRKHIQIWGSGSTISIRLNTSITPVIGLIENYDDSLIKPNPKEVDRVFQVPVESLIDTNIRKHTQFTKYSSPLYIWNNEKIWGMTAIITHFFLSALLPKEQYDRKIGFVKKYK